jgi:glucosamine-6-phosphate deaminase
MSRSCVITTEEPNWWPTPPAEASCEVGGTEQEPSAERANGWDRQPVAVVQFADPAGLADWVGSLLLRDRLLRPERPLGLATGRTMEPVYAALARQVNGLTPTERQELRRRWCSFNLDAYVGVDRADPRSFAAEMASRLTTPLGLDPERVHLPDGQAADPHAAAECYAAQLAATGGIGLQLLGLGLNGHVGFNEPPCEADVPCRCIDLSPATRQQNAGAFGGDPEAVPQQAITLGLREILTAERLLLVVTGAAKAEVLARALREPPRPELPASWIQLHPRALVVADGAAAALLDARCHQGGSPV